MKKLELKLTLDFEQIVKNIETAESLNDNDLIFAAFAGIEFERKQLDAAQKAFDEIYKMAKEAINTKAKALYGKEWEAIRGSGYKISHSFTGPVYELTGDDVDDAFMQVKLTANTRAIEEYQKENSKLPKGVAVNEHRGESVRISVNDH